MALEAQNNPFTSVLLVEAADVEALPDADPSAGQQRLAVGTDHLLYLVNSSGTKTLVGSGGGGGSLTSSMNQLGADVTTTTAGTWYTGPTLTLAAGTWLLVAGLTYEASTGKTITARIHNGTSSLCSAVDFVQAGGNVTVPLTVIVTPSGSTTYNVQGTPQTNGGALKAASAFNGVGNNVSTLVALKVA